MESNPLYKQKDDEFWANVKFISERAGYSTRKKNREIGALMKRYDESDVLESFGLKADGGKSKKKKVSKNNGDFQRDIEKLSIAHLFDSRMNPTALCTSILEYLNYRAEVIDTYISQQLMNRDQAKDVFEDLVRRFNPQFTMSMNKQSAGKKHPSYLTIITNIITENILMGKGKQFDGNPTGLTVVTKNGAPLKVLSRRMDGAYPSKINPHVLWEIKEYYGTTSFGSRVADGVYETLLDGYEINELEVAISELSGTKEKSSEYNENDERVKHYLIVDDYFTWYLSGRSYLCRLVDMTHMGYVDEVIFGREVTTRWPEIVNSWI